MASSVSIGSNALYPRNILCNDLLKILYSDHKLASLCGEENAGDSASNKKMKVCLGMGRWSVCKSPYLFLEGPI